MTYLDLSKRINNIGDEGVQAALKNIVNDYIKQGQSADVTYQNIIQTLEDIKVKN